MFYVVRVRIKKFQVDHLFGIYALLKLPMFLSRLNEINGGCEKILPGSGSFWSNLKFLEWWILLRGCECEMWGWMESYHYFPSVTLLVLTGDQFVGRDDGSLE